MITLFNTHLKPHFPSIYFLHVRFWQTSMRTEINATRSAYLINYHCEIPDRFCNDCLSDVSLAWVWVCECERLLSAGDVVSTTSGSLIICNPSSHADGPAGNQGSVDISTTLQSTFIYISNNFSTPLPLLLFFATTSSSLRSLYYGISMLARCQDTYICMCEVSLCGLDCDGKASMVVRLVLGVEAVKVWLSAYLFVNVCIFVFVPVG